MIKKTTKLIATLLLLTVSVTYAQEQIKTQFKWYTDPKTGRFYYNRNLGVYFWVSTSPDPKSEHHLLKSENQPQYSNPMYLDMEGYNTLRSPTAVDTVTKKVASPRQDVRFEVYADGVPPTTSANFLYAPKYVSGGKTFYGKGLEIELKSTDENSGIEVIYYSVDGAPFQKYTEPVDFSKEKNEYTFKYYAIDNVGNYEKINEVKFAVDMSAPITSKQLNGKVTGNVMSRDATITLESKDNMSGVFETFYTIDQGEPKIYKQPISAMVFLGGKHKLNYYSIDNVKNNNISNTNKGMGSDFDFDFIVDENGPKTELTINGDQHKGNFMFVSPRTTFSINAVDEFSEIKEIKYNISNSEEKIYESEFNALDKSGLQNVNYYAQDVVGNIGNKSTSVVYLDNTPPLTGINFGKPQFFHRDTLFINKSTMIKLFSGDDESGLKSIEYSLDGGAFQPYSKEFSISNEGFHKISFRATDNVNNAEQTKESFVMVDNNAPAIYVNFSIEPIREENRDGRKLPVYPPYTKMYLSATDKNTGEELIDFSINGGKIMRYISADNIANAGLISKEQTYKVKVIATDKLGNQSEKLVEFVISKK